MTALRQALAEPEPVAWQWLRTGHFRKKIPKTAYPEDWRPLYIEPPQRQWVGLTEDEKHQLNAALNLQGRFPIIEAIEAKLKEKNT